MIPLVLAATWPPFAAASLLYRSDRAAALAGWLVAALCMAMCLYFGWVPAAAVAAVWMVAAAGLLVTCPPRSFRREQRRLLLQREMAVEWAIDRAREELDRTDHLVPVIKNAPRRVA